MNPLIRTARPEDAAELARLKLASFRQTFVDGGFAIPYPAADLALFEAENYSLAKIESELADPSRRNWVAEIGGRLLGYAQAGPTKLPHPAARPEHGELYQLYVLNEAQGLKLGTRLLDAALHFLAAERPGPVWLGVWSGNRRAQAIYEARGFAKVGEYEFLVGQWADHEYIYRRDPSDSMKPA